MNIQEIKADLAHLSSDDLADFARWFQELQHNDWSQSQSTQEIETVPSHDLPHQKQRTVGLHAGAVRISEDFDQRCILT